MFWDLEMFLRVDGGADRTEKEKDADVHEERALIMYLHRGLSSDEAGMSLSTMVFWLPSLERTKPFGLTVILQICLLSFNFQSMTHLHSYDSWTLCDYFFSVLSFPAW